MDESNQLLWRREFKSWTGRETPRTLPERLAGKGASPSQHGVSEGLDIVWVHTPRPMWTGCQSPLWHVDTFGKSARVTG